MVRKLVRSIHGLGMYIDIKNPVKDFCWWDLDGVVVVVVVVVVVQW